MQITIHFYQISLQLIHYLYRHYFLAPITPTLFHFRLIIN